MKKKTFHMVVAWSLFIHSGLFFFLVRALSQGSIEQVDLAIIQFIQGFERDGLTALLKTMTTIGAGFNVMWITIVLSVVLFFFLHKRWEAYLLTVTVLSTVLFNEGLKSVFKRARPEFHRLVEIGGYSFPSGHTMMAVSLYAMVIFVFWSSIRGKLGRFFLASTACLMAFLIAISRIYLGVHYPSDVFGGFLASAFLLTILLAIFKHIRRTSP